MGVEMTAEVIKVVGSDRDVIMASRISTSREDRKLDAMAVDRAIKHLISQGHWSPFEFQQVWVSIEAPIYVMRQWMRHQGAFIEKSRRYTKDDVKVEFYDEGNETITYSVEEYQELLSIGEKPENARKVLPMATCTKVLWNPNLRDLLFFLRARLDDHAQFEIRQLAQSLWDQVSLFFPSTFKYFASYKLGSFDFSVEELKYILAALPLGGLTGYDCNLKIQERIIKNAKTRLRLVERVLGGMSPEMGDSPEDSTEPKCTPSDSTKIP